MHLSINSVDSSATEALLNLNPAHVERMVINTRHDDQIIFASLDEIDGATNRLTNAYGLNVAGTLIDSTIEASVMIPLADITSIQVTMKSANFYDLSDDRCTNCDCSQDDVTTSVPSPADIVTKLGDFVARAREMKAQFENSSHDSESNEPKLPTDMPDSMREFIEELTDHFGENVDIKVIKVPNLDDIEDNLNAARERAEDVASNLSEVFAKLFTTKAAESDDKSDVEEGTEDTDDAATSHSESSDESLAEHIVDAGAYEDVMNSSDEDDEPKIERIEETTETKLSERTEKVAEVFGGQNVAKTVEPNEKVKTEDAAKTDEADAEPKKLVHVKRGEDDRLFVGPNFESKKNRLGESRLAKLVEQIKTAPVGSKVSVGYRNTGRPGIVTGTGKLVHDLYDRGHGHTAPVGIETTSFAASIIGPNDEIDPDLMELVIFEA